MSPVSIWKKAMTVASTALLFLMEVNFSPSINTSLMSWQTIVLGVGVGWGGPELSEGGGPVIPAREKGLDGSVPVVHVFSGPANKRTNFMGSRHFEHNAYLLASASSLNNSAPRLGHVKTPTPSIAFWHLPPNSARLLMPLKGYSLSPRSCSATRSVPSERFGY